MDLDVEIKKLREDAQIPRYNKPGDSGFDFVLLEDALIEPGETKILPTGLAFAIPEGYELQIRLRSGYAAKTSLYLPNAPGTVDSGYRGEVGIILRNGGSAPFLARKGDRIAQGVIAPVIRANLIETDDLDESERGASGFGASGA